MKNVLLTSLLAVIYLLGVVNDATAFEGSPVNKKALVSFKRKFTAVQNEKWYHYKNRSIVVFFADEVKYTMEYSSRGYLTGTEKIYGENKLDREVRRIVKSVYFDYKITWIREISVPGLFPLPVYIVNIEDEDGFKNLSVYDGEMRTVNECVKYKD